MSLTYCVSKDKTNNVEPSVRTMPIVLRKCTATGSHLTGPQSNPEEKNTNLSRGDDALVHSNSLGRCTYFVGGSWKGVPFSFQGPVRGSMALGKLKNGARKSGNGISSRVAEASLGQPVSAVPRRWFCGWPSVILHTAVGGGGAAGEGCHRSV